MKEFFLSMTQNLEVETRFKHIFMSKKHYNSKPNY